MCNKQKVEKTTHLQAQLTKLNKDLDFPINNTLAIANYYKNALKRYALQ